MKRFIFIVALAAAGLGLSGCVDFGTAYLEEGLDPALVRCELVVLTVATNQTAQCEAINAEGTLIDIGGFAPVAWSSDAPNIISVTTAGVIRAEPASFTSEGTNINACGPEVCASLAIATR